MALLSRVVNGRLRPQFSGLFFRRGIAQKVSAANLRSKILEQAWFAERRMEFYMRMEVLIICAISVSGLGSKRCFSRWTFTAVVL